MTPAGMPSQPRLELLGGAWLHLGRQRLRLERKTAGCLTYLAFEGEQPRTVVAGLLWPDVVEARAKGNLRQCLYKLKQTADIVRGEELLSLFGLEVDTVALENQAMLGDGAPLTVLRGEILSGYSFDDCPEFEDWLHRTRQRWLALRRTAFREQIQQTPHLEGKLGVARSWLEFEPLSEGALRTLVALLLEARLSSEARAVIEAFQARHERDYNEPAPHVMALLDQPELTGTPQALLEAARTAQQEVRHAEGVNLLLQAADAFAARGELGAECDALQDAFDLMVHFDRTERFDALLERIAGLARTPQQVLRWRKALMYRAYGRGQWEVCQREAERVVRLATRLDDDTTALDARGFIAATHMELGNLEAAAQEFEQVLETTRRIGDEALIQKALANLAYVRHGQGRREESLHLVSEALEIAESTGDVAQQLVYLNNMTMHAKGILKPSEVLDFARRGLALHQHISGHEAARIMNLGFLGEIHRNAGQYRDALEMIGRALQIGTQQNISCAYLHRMNASVLLQLGAFAQTQAELERGFARSDAGLTDLMSLSAVQMRLNHWQGTGSLKAVDDTIDAWRVRTDAGYMRRFQFERSYYLHGQERVETVREALGGIQGFAEFFLGLAWLEAGRPEEALPITARLVEQLKDSDPNDLYTPEILLTHARTLSALEHPDAPLAWQQARDWVLDKLKHHVPDEFKQDFLQTHPINRAILGTLRAIEASSVSELSL